MTMDVTADIQDFAADVGNSGWFTRLFNAQTGAKVKEFAKTKGTKAALTGTASLVAKFGTIGALTGLGAATIAPAGALLIAGAVVGGLVTGTGNILWERHVAMRHNETCALEDRKVVPSLRSKDTYKALAISSAMAGFGGAFGADIFKFAVDNARWLATATVGGVAASVKTVSDQRRAVELHNAEHPENILPRPNYFSLGSIKAFVFGATAGGLAGAFAPEIVAGLGVSEALAFVPKPQFDMPSLSLFSDAVTTPSAEDLVTGDVDAKITLAADDSARIEQANAAPELSAEPSEITPQAEPSATTPDASAETTPSNEPAVEPAATAPVEPEAAPATTESAAPAPTEPAPEAPAQTQAATASAEEPAAASETPAPVIANAQPEVPAAVQPQQPAEPLFVSADDVAAAANAPMSSGFGFNSYAAASPFSQPVPTGGAVAAVAAAVIPDIDVTSKIGELVDLSKVSKKTAKLVQEALAGDDQSMKDLAVYMLHGTRKGVAQNSEAAIALFKKAASLGNDQAKFDLAKMGLKGEYGVPKAVKASMTHIRELAGEGFRPAKQMLAQVGGTGKSASAAMRKAAAVVVEKANDTVTNVATRALPQDPIGLVRRPDGILIAKGQLAQVLRSVPDGTTVRVPMITIQKEAGNIFSDAANALTNALPKIQSAISTPMLPSLQIR